MKRRDFLKQGLKVGVAVNALPLMMGGLPMRVLGRSPLRSALESASANDHILVIIQLAGGNDGLNTLIPYSNPTYKELRPTLGLSSTDGIFTLKDHDTLAFHQSMTGISDLYTQSKVAILQNVGYPNPDLSHFRGTDIWNTATDSNRFASTGWIGRLLGDMNPDYPPSVIPDGSHPLAIQFGSSLSNLFLGRNGGMGIAISSLPTENANGDIHNYDPVSATPTIPYQELDYVRTIERETEVYTKSLLDQVKVTNKATYPANNTLATQLASVAKIIASGFTTKIYLVTQGSYDTHSDQLTDQATLLTNLSGAVAAFQQDLEALGVADKVVTMTYSEFGRRPKENGSGTDHGTAAPLFVFGTQVNGGVKGNDPDLINLMNNNLAYEARHDFRNVYASIMSEWLGVQDSEISGVLTASNGQTFSTSNNWLHLGIIKGQVASAVTQADSFGIALMQNYPNPFLGRTTIEFSLPERSPVELSVFNTAGQEVSRIVEGTLSAGIHRTDFTSGTLPSGAYFYRLRTATAEVSRQMIITH